MHDHHNERLYVMILACCAFVCAADDQHEYEKAQSSFVGQAHLWLGESLEEKLLRLKKQESNCYVIFSDLWKTNKSIVSFVISYGAFSDVQLLEKGGLVKNIKLEDFQSLCKRPAALSYKRKVYISVPDVDFREELMRSRDKMPIGTLLLDGVYDAMKELDVELPPSRFSVCVGFEKGSPLTMKNFCLSDSLTLDMIADAVISRESTKSFQDWKKEHEKLVRQLPRRPPVVYGDVSKIVKNSDGTFVIPKEPPQTTRTIKWTETIWSQGTGYTDSGEAVTVSVPVGTRECQRTKKISGQGNYADLKRRLEEYERLLKRIDEDKPPQVDVEVVKETMFRIRSVKAKVK